MKIILLQDVPGLGKKYDVKNVSDGYARNFLLPRKLAKIATTQAIQFIEKEKTRLEQERQLQQDIFDKNLKSLEKIKISIKEKANEKGNLFAAIQPEAISKILKGKIHLDIPAKMIKLEKPIKEIGEHKIKVNGQEFILEISSL